METQIDKTKKAMADFLKAEAVFKSNFVVMATRCEDRIKAGDYEDYHRCKKYPYPCPCGPSNCPLLIPVRKEHLKGLP